MKYIPQLQFYKVKLVLQTTNTYILSRTSLQFQCAEDVLKISHQSDIKIFYII